MCSTGHGHSHSHGVLSDAEKAVADLRDDLSEVLKMINKLEYQRAVIGGADFPAAGEVVHTLEHMLEDKKRHAATLLELITLIDVSQRKKFEGDNHEHEHEHEHAHEHDYTHKH